MGRRSVALTPETASQARRLVGAAEYFWEAGDGSRAEALLDEAEPIASDPTVCASIAHLRGAIELAVGTPAVACTLLVQGALPVLESDPRQAAEMLVLATWGALARIRSVADSLIVFGLGPAEPDGAPEDPPRDADTPSAAAASWPHPAFAWMWPMLVLADPVGGGVTADLGYARSVAARRAAGTVSGLTVALANLVLAETSLGKWPDAIEIGTEGLRLARETGQEAMASYFLAMLAGIAAERGRSKECRRLVHEALAAAVPRRSRALLSSTEDAERHFQAALATDGIAQLPLELARTELLYGESLRRARRRADARRHLRTALDLFKQLGASPWAERAASELRASGETARRRDPSTLQQLTPRNCGSHASPVGD